MKFFKNKSLRTKLVLLNMALLLTLTAFLFGIIQYTLAKSKESIEKNFTNYSHILEYGIAAQFYERYGDVQAFAANPNVVELNAAKLTETLNTYVKLYGIYDLIVVVSKDGKFVAGNTISTAGSAIDIKKLSSMNFSDAPWFKSVIENKTTDEAAKNLSGTYVEDPQFDPLLERVYGKPTYGSGFSSAIKNEKGEIIGVISNRANAQWFSKEFLTAYLLMKKQNLDGAELTLLDKNGTVLFEYDPTLRKSSEVIFDSNTLGKLNLKEKGVEAALYATQGKDGYIISRHVRKNVDQVAAYSAIQQEEKFVSSLGWSVLVRAAADEVFATNNFVKNMFYLSSGILLVIATIILLLFSKNLVASIIDVVTNLSSTSEVIAINSKDISEGSVKLADAVSLTASAVEETAASATEVTAMSHRATELATDSSKELAEMVRLAAESRSAINQVNESMIDISESSDNIIKQIEKGNSEIEKIMVLIDEISTKTKVIDDIVFQTKLLSFNASVEAARAGDQGKGFSVVAEEVGKLAVMSGEQSKEIATLLSSRTVEIRQMIAQSKDATAVLATEIKEKIETGVAVTLDCLNSFEKINQQCQNAAKYSNEIAASNKEQSLGIEQITEAMVSIGSAANDSNHISKLTSKTSESMYEESRNLNSQIDNLKEMVHGH